MAKKHLQKLELTWIGKGEEPKLEPRILIENPEYSYGDPKSENILIHGDNLLALKALEQDYAGKIKCVYIDPPYNTGSAWEHYDDGIEHSLWLDLMSRRLVVLKNLLSNDGCIFIHIDNSEQAYLKVMCDEIFGRNNFITSFTIQVRHTERMLKGDKDIHDVVEYVHMYQKSNSFKINKRQKLESSNKYEGYEYAIVEKASGHDVVLGNKQCKYFLPNEYELKKVDPNEKGFKKINIRGGLREGNSSGRFYVTYLENRISEEGFNVLYRIPNMGDDHFGDRYFISRENEAKKNGNYFQGMPLTRSKSQELPYPSFFDFQGIFNRVGYEGIVSFRNSKKPEALIKLFFEIAGVGKDNIVLDSFLGSGTTAAVAHKLGYKWIGVEIGIHAITHCYPRLKAVIDNDDFEGVTNEANWQGGGGFKFYTLAPSLLKKDKFGNWIISEEYNADMLAAAMAKQEGFTYNPSDTQYWKQGQSSEQDFIFTTTQFLTIEALDRLHDDMRPGESLLICCKSFHKGCGSKYANITVKKIPQLLLNRCEFGKEDYSLNIIHLPTDESKSEEKVEAKIDNIPVQEINAKTKKPTKSNINPSLFD